MKVVFDFAKNQVSIEGEGTDLLDVLKEVQVLAPKLSRIELVTTPTKTADASLPPAGGGDSGSGGGGGAGTGPRSGLGLREFARALNPTNNYEKIAIIAAYKARYEKIETFSPKEMAEWFVMCGFERPAQMPVALFDAKRKYGYMDKSGHGQWKLANEGINLVTRRQEAAGVGQ